MTIPEFGQKVLDYFENTTHSGDTILFSLDSEIYEQEIFNGDVSSKIEFEKHIKKHVENNGLNLLYVNNPDLYSIALAAHQIVLSYQFRDDENTISNALLNFYYPNQINPNILYNNYYGNNQNGKNYQEKLWNWVQCVVQKKIGRKLIIPTNPGGNRDQKYIKAQLCLFTNLKKYFFLMFHRYGFSKEILYSKDEFITRIKNVNRDLNYSITGKIVDSFWNKLKKYSQDDFGSLSLDDNLLYELLWTMYNFWDGTFPYDDSYYSSDDFYNPIYVELNDDNCTYTTQQGNFFPTMLISTTNRNCYFRFFTYIGYNIWEVKDSAVNDLPESETFVCLINKKDKKFFSKKRMIEYEPSDELLKSEPSLNDYLILKYFSLPRDFYDGFPCVDNLQLNDGLQLRGGLKLNRKNYLFFSDKRICPSVYAGAPRMEQKAETGIINGVQIEEYITKDRHKLRIHLYEPTDNRVQEEIIPIYKNMPDFKFYKKNPVTVEIDKSGVDITNYKFRADLKGLVNKGGFIPISRITVITENGYINIKDFEYFSEYNRSQLINVKFGWFEKDDELFSPSESITDRLKIVKTIEFKIKLEKEIPQISEFWVTEIYNCSVEDYFGTENFSKEPKLPECIEHKEQNFYEELKFIHINNNETYEIKKQSTPIYYDEIRTYQKALCIWLCHQGGSSYKAIQDVCRNMIQKTDFPEIYREAPEYQIFIPLLKIGLIIPILDKDNKTVFRVIDKYEEILLGKDIIKNENLEDYMINLSSMLNISELFAPSQMIDLQVFVRYSKLSWSWNTQKIKSSELIYPCIYKCDFDPWKPVYFALDNQHYYLLNRENPDSYSVCKSIINREHYFESNSVKPAFEYYSKQKLLVCRYFPDIPTLFTRLLMLANPEKYTEEEIYLSGISDYREQYFENIDFNFVKELDKRLIR